MLDMPYEFPPDLEHRVKAQMVLFGLTSEDAVLRAAMDALEQLENEKLRRWNDTNSTAIQQSCGGESQPLDLDQLLDRIEYRVSLHSQDA